MSTRSRWFLIFIPLSAVGLCAVAYQFFVNTSALNATTLALVWTGVVVPLLLALAGIISLSGRQWMRVCLTCLITAALALVVTAFGEPIASALGVGMVTYAWFPGKEIEAVATLLAFFATCAIALYASRGARQTH